LGGVLALVWRQFGQKVGLLWEKVAGWLWAKNRGGLGQFVEMILRAICNGKRLGQGMDLGSS